MSDSVAVLTTVSQGGTVIGIRSEKNDLVVSFRAGYPIDGLIFELRWAAGSEWSARLLAHSLRSRISDLLSRIRREAYEDGWRDAKAKRRKATWWPGNWPTP